MNLQPFASCHFAESITNRWLLEIIMIEEKSKIGVFIEERLLSRKRITNAVLIGLPAVGTIYSMFYFQQRSFGVVELSSFLVFYLLSGVGVGLGLHRYATHQAFRPKRSLKLLLLFLGSLAFQGSVIRWVADHRRHHRLSDSEWDVHSPIWHEDKRFSSKLLGLVHAHLGWMFDRTSTEYAVYAPDLLKDSDVLFFHKHYPAMCLLSLALPSLYGFTLGGFEQAFATLLVGGCLRITALHNVIWAVNSFGHSFGRQDASKHDSSRNSLVLAILTFGEGWHNNHHAFPRSAWNQWKWYQVDPNGWLLVILERLGLVDRMIYPKKERTEHETKDYLDDGEMT